MSDVDAKDTAQQWPGSSPEDCQRMVDYALKRNPTVKFMTEKLEEVTLDLQNHCVSICVSIAG